MIDNRSEDDDLTGSSRVSERKRQANARNARRSTGPRTPRGKEVSAANALKHGGFAATARAIPRGAYAEDTAEVDRFVEDLVEALAPRDAVEHEQAGRIARCYLKAHRLDRYEADLLSSGPTRSTDTQASERRQLEQRAANANAFLAWAATGKEPTVDLPEILQKVVVLAKLTGHLKRDIGFEGEPEENLQLSTNVRLAWYLDHFFANRLDAAEWAGTLLEDRIAELSNYDAARVAAAGKMIERCNQVGVPNQRNARELEQALRRYEILQRRALSAEETSAPRNEPTDS
jgi:hypothetical protein